MEIALHEADQGADAEEVPVGAVLVMDGKIIATDHNRNIQANDSTAHAEILVIRKACERLNQKRLDGAWIYVTKEPCPMCAGALVIAHIDKLIFGLSDEKMGCAGSILNLTDHPRFNHQLIIQKGLMETECLRQLQTFFQKLRKRM